MTVDAAFRKGLVRLQNAGIEDAEFDCACLLETASGFDRSFRLAHPQAALEKTAEQSFFRWIDRRISGEPLQYILGKWSFYGRDFFVGEGVLIPRPETEQLVELVSSRIQERGCRVIFDLCAGSGCIGLTLALEHPDCQVYLFEKYAPALSYLRRNQTELQVQNVTICQADILKELPQNGLQADLLVSNPPYIPQSELPALQREVQAEPVTALDGGADGLDFYRVIAEKWMPFVRKNGEIWLECGDGQGKAVADLFSQKSTRQSVLFDWNHIDRIVHIHV